MGKKLTVPERIKDDRGMQPARSRWPTVIGWISIGVSGVLLLCAGLEGIATPAGPLVMMFLPAVIPSAALLLAGLLVLRRNAAAKKLFWFYAFVFIFFEVLTFPSAPASEPVTWQERLSGWFFIAVPLVYPIFLIWWFARPKIRREVESWAGEGPVTGIPPGGEK